MLYFIAVALLLVVVSIKSLRIKAWKTLISCFDFCFNIFDSFRHNYGRYAGDLFISFLLIHAGYECALKIHSPENHPWTDLSFWSSIVIAILIKIRRYQKYSIASGKEFDVFFNLRSDLANKRGALNNRYLPVVKQGWDYKSHSVIIEYLEGLLSTHLDFLLQTLRSGFSWRGRDFYSVSVLFFNVRNQEWIHWKTFYPTETSPRKKRQGSHWPIAKAKFSLSCSMYLKSTRENIFEVKHFMPEAGYRSVLSIPFYHKQTGKGEGKSHEQKDEIFALLCYTTSNLKSFDSINPSSYIRYFGAEASLAERVVYRIYKSYNF